MADEAVQLAAKTWGERSLTEIEAEERLSYSCEKVRFLLPGIRSVIWLLLVDIFSTDAYICLQYLIKPENCLGPCSRQSHLKAAECVFGNC